MPLDYTVKPVLNVTSNMTVFSAKIIKDWGMVTRFPESATLFELYEGVEQKIYDPGDQFI